MAHCASQELGIVNFAGFINIDFVEDLFDLVDGPVHVAINLEVALDEIVLGEGAMPMLVYGLKLFL